MIRSTVTPESAAQRLWDVIVVGAGPAGSVAALETAKRGCSVLLVDRAVFPRYKLCGACLSGSAVAGLKQLGLDADLNALQPVPLHRFALRSGNRRLDVAVQGGVAVSRERLDAALVQAAVRAGARFLSGVSLQVTAPEDSEPFRTLQAGATSLRAKAVVVASGLTGISGSDEPAFETVRQNNARIGVGTGTEKFPADYQPGVIYMTTGTAGYVGLTRVEDGSLNIAAALDPAALHGRRPDSVCREIVESCGMPVCDDMFSGEWKGTVGLTRGPRFPAATRLFIVGDAAGYVEPFTGEGMAWAVKGGAAVARLAQEASREWHADLIPEWKRTLRTLVTGRQRWCRRLARALRYPALVRSLMWCTAAVPSIGRAIVRRVHEAP